MAEKAQSIKFICIAHTDIEMMTNIFIIIREDSIQKSSLAAAEREAAVLVN